jgi:hypothetical protein
MISTLAGDSGFVLQHRFRSHQRGRERARL